MKLLGHTICICLLIFVNTTVAQNYALFFACNDYQYERQLVNPVPNANVIAAILKEEYDFDTEVIENPTLEEIEGKLEAYKTSFQQSKRDTDGQLLIFFSGHGAIESNIGFFLPVDAQPGKLRHSALDYPYWQNYIDEIPCKHIFVGVDACHSVRFDPKWDVMKSNYFDRPGELSNREKLLLTHQETTTRIFFTSDGKDMETPDKSNFAKKFLEGLKIGGGDDGILTSVELYARVREASPSPHCGDFGRDEPGSSFLFIKNKRDVSDTKAELAAWITAKRKNTIAAYQTFLTTYGKGDFAGLARENINTLEGLAQKKRASDAWQQVLKSRSVAAYQDFIKRFPKSKEVETAKEEISKLEEEATRKLDEEAFNIAKSTGDFHAYLDRFPSGMFRRQAQAAITRQKAEAQLEKDILAWQKAKTLNTEAAYRTYLSDFPNGNFAEVAQAKVETYTEIPPGDTKVLDLPNAPRMIFIKGGTFSMGSTEGDDDEKPTHFVTVSDFYLAETEVTFSQYDYFCEQTNRTKPNDQGWGRGERPVINISWIDAVAYCKWLSEVSGETYRLPTEAEWEYAAGGGDSNRTKWAGTHTESSLRLYGNYSGISGSDRYEHTAPVKTFQANDLGLYDMSGNVWEWCSNRYGSYTSRSQTNPIGPHNGSYRVRRGGSWLGSPSGLRVANRLLNIGPSERSYSLGFRPAKTP